LSVTSIYCVRKPTNRDNFKNIAAADVENIIRGIGLTDHNKAFDKNILKSAWEINTKIYECVCLIVIN